MGRPKKIVSNNADLSKDIKQDVDELNKQEENIKQEEVKNNESLVSKSLDNVEFINETIEKVKTSSGEMLKKKVDKEQMRIIEQAGKLYGVGKCVNGIYEILYKE